MFGGVDVAHAAAKLSVCTKADNVVSIADQIGTAVDGDGDIGNGFGHGVKRGRCVFDIVIPDRHNCGCVIGGGGAYFHEGDI